MAAGKIYTQAADGWLSEWRLRQRSDLICWVTGWGLPHAGLAVSVTPVSVPVWDPAAAKIRVRKRNKNRPKIMEHFCGWVCVRIAPVCLSWWDPSAVTPTAQSSAFCWLRFQERSGDDGALLELQRTPMGRIKWSFQASMEAESLATYQSCCESCESATLHTSSTDVAFKRRGLCDTCMNSGPYVRFIWKSMKQLGCTCGIFPWFTCVKAKDLPLISISHSIPCKFHPEWDIRGTLQVYLYRHAQWVKWLCFIQGNSIIINVFTEEAQCFECLLSGSRCNHGNDGANFSATCSLWGWRASSRARRYRKDGS